MDFFLGVQLHFTIDRFIYFQSMGKMLWQKVFSLLLVMPIGWNEIVSQQWRDTLLQECVSSLGRTLLLCSEEG